MTIVAAGDIVRGEKRPETGGAPGCVDQTAWMTIVAGSPPPGKSAGSTTCTSRSPLASVVTKGVATPKSPRPSKGPRGPMKAGSMKSVPAATVGGRGMGMEAGGPCMNVTGRKGSAPCNETVINSERT